MALVPRRSLKFLFSFSQIIHFAVFILVEPFLINMHDIVHGLKLCFCIIQPRFHEANPFHLIAFIKSLSKMLFRSWGESLFLRILCESELEWSIINAVAGKKRNEKFNVSTSLKHSFCSTGFVAKRRTPTERSVFQDSANHVDFSFFRCFDW